MSIKPIFLLSLPRAGSTLLQRLLSLNGGISTKSEPWIALPLFFALKERSVRSIYGHNTLTKGISGFVDSFPHGIDDYYASSAKYLNAMYALGAEPGSTYFLDKTPRYHLIVDELFKAFPDGKFIFLWRNPLAVSASMIETYGKGNWNLYMFWVDLYSGIDSLINAFNQNSARSIAVKYEDLVAQPNEQIMEIMDYLELEYTANSVDELKNAKKMWGDRTGQYKYDHISQASKDKWKSVLSNPFRKTWAMNYLSWIGQDRLTTMGYDINILKSEIENQQTNLNHAMSDIARDIYGKIYCKYAIDDIRTNQSFFDNKYYCKN